MFHVDLSCAIQNSKKLYPAVDRLPNLRLLRTFTKKRATKNLSLSRTLLNGTIVCSS